MVRVTEWKISALNILDYLFIHDLASMTTFSDLKNKFYFYISNKIDTINSELGFDGSRAEIYRHYLLCGIELNLNQVFESDSREIIEELLHRVKSNNFDLFRYLQDIFNICEHSNTFCLNGTVKNKLLAQFLYYDFDSTTMLLFNKFLNLKILHHERFNENKMQIEYKKDMDVVLLRVLMFCEFEILKKKVFFNSSEILKKMDCKKIMDGNVREIRKYLIFINKGLGHNGRVFNRDVRNIVGLVGAFLYIEEKSRNIYYNKKQVNYVPDYNKPIDDLGFLERNNREVIICTEYTNNKMREYGYDYSERSYYNNYIRLYRLHNFVRIFFDDITKNGVWYHNFVDIMFNDDGYPEIYKTGLKQAMDGLQLYKPKK